MKCCSAKFALSPSEMLLLIICVSFYRCHSLPATFHEAKPILIMFMAFKSPQVVANLSDQAEFEGPLAR
jgi:hypothetical protein